MTTTIIALGLLYFIGHWLTHFFNRTKVPDVLILIVFGMLLGPIFHIVDPANIGRAGELFTAVALIIILFESGLDLELSTLRRSAGLATKLTVSTFFATAFIIFAILYWGFGYSPMAGLVMGFICGGTSSAVVIPLVGALKVGKKAATMLILESVLTDVLCIIFALGVLASIYSGEIEVGRIIGNLISSLVFALVIGILGGILWIRILEYVRNWTHTQFATFAFMFIVYGVADLLHFSGPIAALAFGIWLGNYKTLEHRISFLSNSLKTNTDHIVVVSDAEKKLYKEIVFLLKIFFFVYLGISIPIEHIYTAGVASCIVMAVYLMRPIVTKIVVGKHISAYDNTIVSIMVPKGLAAAVLAGLPSQYGMIEGADIQAFTYNVILISIILTSVLIPIINRTTLGGIMMRFFGNDEKTSEEVSNDD